jgi:hypothetical protein
LFGDHDSETGLSRSSWRDGEINLGSVLGRCVSVWCSDLALRRAARNAAKRWREMSFVSLMVNGPSTMELQNGMG